MANKKYQTKALALLLSPNLTTQIDGVPVALGTKEIRYQRRFVAGGPLIDMVAKPATQAQLKALFEAGNPNIEEVEDAAPVAAAPSANK